MLQLQEQLFPVLTPDTFLGPSLTHSPGALLEGSSVWGSPVVEAFMEPFPCSAHLPDGRKPWSTSVLWLLLDGPVTTSRLLFPGNKRPRPVLCAPSFLTHDMCSTSMPVPPALLHLLISTEPHNFSVLHLISVEPKSCLSLLWKPSGSVHGLTLLHQCSCVAGLFVARPGIWRQQWAPLSS